MHRDERMGQIWEGSIAREAIMAITKNVAKVERLVRIILGIILIILGFLLTGFWRPASIIVGVLLLLTAFIGY